MIHPLWRIYSSRIPKSFESILGTFARHQDQKNESAINQSPPTRGKTWSDSNSHVTLSRGGERQPRAGK